MIARRIGQRGQRLVGGVQQQHPPAIPDRSALRRVGGWVRHCAGLSAVAGPVSPAAAPELRWLRRLLPCAIRPPPIVHHDSPPIARLIAGARRVNPVNSRSDARGPVARGHDPAHGPQWRRWIRCNSRSTTLSAAPRLSTRSCRAFMSWSPRTKYCGSCIPKTTWPAPRSGCGCSSSSTGVAREPTPTSADIPRLRMRHAPFRITPIERDAWLRCMHTAVASIDSQTLDDEHRRELLDYLEMAAHSLVNSRVRAVLTEPEQHGPARGGRTRFSTRCIRGHSPTATATGSATSTAWRPGWTI